MNIKHNHHKVQELSVMNYNMLPQPKNAEKVNNPRKASKYQIKKP